MKCIFALFQKISGLPLRQLRLFNRNLARFTIKNKLYRNRCKNDNTMQHLITIRFDLEYMTDATLTI